MSSSETHAHSPYLAHHFPDLRTQNYAARLGMWLFLATEVLLFAALFTGYAVYRWLFPETFKVASSMLDLTMGTINTVVLISSSLSVALAFDAIKRNDAKEVFSAAGLDADLRVRFLGHQIL